MSIYVVTLVSKDGQTFMFKTEAVDKNEAGSKALDRLVEMRWHEFGYVIKSVELESV